MDFLFFIIFLFVNLILLAKTMPHKKIFFWYEYIGLFILPLFVVAALAYVHGYTILVIFVSWIVLGPLLESFVGHTYLLLTGKHLWVYQKLPLFNKTTSYLAIPFWAFGGTVFYSVNEIVQLILRK